MDPDQALQEIRDVLAELDAQYEDLPENVQLLVKLVGNLDQFLTRGGCWPKQWEQYTR